MTVSDFIIDYLVSIGVKHTFLITGGAIAFTIDAFSNRRDIGYICVEHEQAAAMAADAYSRLGPGIGVAITTSGPGATNLLTGICCSWFDSIPTLLITGQVNTFEQKGQLPVRQIGFQETDIVAITKPITKFAEQLDRPENIKYLLEKAIYIANSGRPGPVLIDIPQDFQRIEIKKIKLKGFTPPKELNSKKKSNELDKQILKSVKLLNEAKRPILLVGGGVKISKAQKEITQLCDLLKIPVVTSWSGNDLVPFKYKYRVGNIGVCGDRFANFAIQSADLILAIGSRLDTRQTGGRPELFAPKAKKIVVDIDEYELKKDRGLKIDLPITQDAKKYINALLKKKSLINVCDTSYWLKVCQIWKENYPTVKKEYYSEKLVNPYVFTKILSEELDKDAIIIPDDGANLVWTIQGFELKKGQQMFSSFGNSPMGYSVPAAIGASIALNKKEIICIDGDGSIQMNIQELQTAVFNKLPLKIFILNNHGYGIIKQFQATWLGGRYEATGKGYSAPDFLKVAKAYGVKTYNITNHKSLRTTIKKVLLEKEIIVVNVEIEPEQKITPRIEYGRPLEDMYPFLPKVEIENNLQLVYKESS